MQERSDFKDCLRAESKVRRTQGKVLKENKNRVAYCTVSEMASDITDAFLAQTSSTWQYVM